MKRRTVVGLSLIIISMIIASTLIVGSVTIIDSKKNITSGYIVNPTEEILCIDEIEVNKTIWNGLESSWTDSAFGIKDNIVRFKITITYYANCDTGYKASDIEVIDTLPPCLVYANDAVIIHGDSTFSGESGISGKQIFWNLTDTYGIKLFNNTWAGPRNVSIIFNATVIDYTDEAGEINQVEVTAFETCCHFDLQGSDQATVIVPGAPTPDIQLIQKVNDDGSWIDSVTVDVGDDVEFKLTVINTGNVELTSVHITDDLPSFLTYNDDANLTPLVSSDHHIEWIGTLPVEDSQEVLFSAHANAVGEADNIAIVTASYDLADEDAAHVIVEEESSSLTLFEKKVWNETSQQWEESINADIGDIVRFNITISYQGDNVLHNINVTDTLPPCLDYADNAVPVEFL
jgi:uncharacterized repeat protein (TIGR01451 family)/fimbrial isopeptide formation D2 family protein